MDGVAVRAHFVTVSASADDKSPDFDVDKNCSSSWLRAARVSCRKHMRQLLSRQRIKAVHKNQSWLLLPCWWRSWGPGGSDHSSRGGGV